MTKPDGGPAYPCIKTNYAIHAEIADKFPDLYQHIKAFETPMNGMTLRDAMAIAALPAVMESVSSSKVTIETVFSMISSMSYKVADAMLAERDK